MPRALISLAWLALPALAAPGQEPLAQPSSEQPPLRIAVLHLRDTTDWGTSQADGGFEKPAPYVARGMSAMLATDLASMGGVQLLEREDVEALYQEGKLNEAQLLSGTQGAEAGKALGADVVVLGYLRRKEGFVRITPALLRVAEGRVTRLRALEGESADLPALVARLKTQYAEALGLKPAPSAPPVAAQGQPPAFAVRLAVMDLRDDSPPEQGASPGGTLADFLSSALAELPGRFDLLDRAKVREVVKEQAQALAGLTQRKELTSLGKLLGAQYLVLGSCVRGGGNLRVDIRLVAPASSRTIAVLAGARPAGEAAALMRDLAGRLAAVPLPKPAGAGAPPVAATGGDREGITDEKLEEQFQQSVRDLDAFWRRLLDRTCHPNWDRYFDDVTEEDLARGADLVRAFKRFTYLRPGVGKYHYYVGRACFEARQYEEAREELAQAARLNHEPVDCAFRSAHTFMLEGRYAEAVKAFEAAGQRFPELVTGALYWAAKCWEAQGNVDRKRQLLARIVQLDPQYPEKRFRLARSQDIRNEALEMRLEELRVIHHGYRQALETRPWDFKIFCYFIRRWYRSSPELDTRLQIQRALADLSELEDRARVKYLYFQTERHHEVWAPQQKEHIFPKPQDRNGDLGYLLPDEKGQFLDKWWNMSRKVEGQEALVYRLSFPRALRVLVSPDIHSRGDTRLLASPDGRNWTEVLRRDFGQGRPRSADATALAESPLESLDLSRFVARDGTVFLRLEDSTPTGGQPAALYSLSAMGYLPGAVLPPGIPPSAPGR